MKGVEYDHSWVPKHHWLAVEENHKGWIASLNYRANEAATWERVMYREPIMMPTRTKPNWLGMSKPTTKQVSEVLDLKEKDIIAAFDKLKVTYFNGVEHKKSEAERYRMIQEIQGKYTGRLGGEK